MLGGYVGRVPIPRPRTGRRLHYMARRKRDRAAIYARFSSHNQRISGAAGVEVAINGIS